MREIKFRAWDEEAQKMSYSTIEHFDDMLGFRFNHFETDEPIFMQYTGLRDKNGREIYEGDIIETTHKMKGESWLLRYRVFFNEKGYWDAKSIDEEKPYIMCYNGFHRCKKIGNIYENPELVK